MYSLNMPVSKIRTKVRQEFEKHRYVNQLRAVDVLIMQNNMEFQVSDYTLYSSGSKGHGRTDSNAGNAELLETIDAYHEILQSRRRPDCEVTEELFVRLLGGELAGAEKCEWNH